MKKSITQTEIEYVFKHYHPLLNTEDIHDRFLGLDMIGNEFSKPLKYIPEIIDELQGMFNQHEWFMNAIDKLDYFFFNFYNDKILMNLGYIKDVNNLSLKDNVWNLYLKVLKELNYEY